VASSLSVVMGRWPTRPPHDDGPQTLRDGAPWAALALREEDGVDRLIERVTGLDVHKASVKACVRVPAQRPGERQSQTRTFRTTTAVLVLLRDAGLAGQPRGDGGGDGVDRGAAGSRSRTCWKTTSSAGC
jgi:hypothetical protein